MFDEFGINAGLVEELHAKFQQNPQAVDVKWRKFFESLNGAPNGNGAPIATVSPAAVSGAFSAGGGAPSAAPPTVAAALRNGNGNGAVSPTVNGSARASYAPPALTISRAEEQLVNAVAVQGRVYQLVNMYRSRGHLFARVDPLVKDPSIDPTVAGAPPEASPELDLENFDLAPQDLENTFATGGISGLPERTTLRQIVAHMSETYCGSIGVEYTHIEEPEMRDWLEHRMESTRNRAALDHKQVVRILTKLTDAEVFENFIAKNYLGARRFSVEGAESVIALLAMLVDEAGTHGVGEIVLGMAHRGRLNVLANIMEKDVRELFAAFDDKKPERFLGGGDVKYHLGYSTDRVTSSGASVHLSLAFNPSHLEFVNPVVEGRVRAKQDRAKRKHVLPLLIHGDASFMGQGVVPETLNLAGLEGYSTEGTVHVVVNNQIGFTTLPKDSRSTRYCTDITRMMKTPVFHVNGEDPEAVIQVTRLAMEYRQRFQKDVVIDVYCYRKLGHNEGDEPRFTQPIMYALIDKKPTVREVYVQRLLETHRITRQQADDIERASKQRLDDALVEARKGDYHTLPSAMEGLWTPYYGGPDVLVPEVPTHVDKTHILDTLDRLTKVPHDFTPNAKAHALIKARRDRARTQNTIQWETAETLAYATLLEQGHRVRLSGQDCRRGTFSHRHAVLYDTQTGAPFVPLANAGPGRFEVLDSPLSEAAVLGFEYGYSLDWPDGLVIWEAQFGDFMNGAQVIIDQFIVSAEDKWNRLSGLVLFLPHGYEGQGPEHSSGRIERFLQAAAEDNIQVCNLTTPAQVFHVLRRQVLRPWRKPLVVFTPKSLLRHPEAISTVDDLATGSFQRVIPDASVDPKQTKRVLLCTGKVYYDLVKTRRDLKRDDVAIVRLEQLYPLNVTLKEALAPYPDGTPLVWVQEEPRNMGAWYFLNARLREFITDRLPLSLVSRVESASPATGSKASHDLEQRMLMDAAFG
ncbi:2-oxoglutarate dehydrogenase E1 component [Pendulispora rubella]|uniref:oxoglutarate dehydrogenase (succinyl-transferring) n=2 Tax=Pendulispora rubella TaxID=2741070 RepID=A0ABZ2LI47_9BACT